MIRRSYGEAARYTNGCVGTGSRRTVKPLSGVSISLPVVSITVRGPRGASGATNRVATTWFPSITPTDDGYSSTEGGEGPALQEVRQCRRDLDAEMLLTRL